ncbi:hypothetical protein LLG95_01840 [bacterium]|nr:hypothetical protein [bacterium]
MTLRAFIIVPASLLLMVVIPALSFAGPGLIQYQGRLTDPAGNPVTTPVSITFTFWSAATGGTQLGGTYYDTDTVTPNSQGLFSAMIGDETGAKIPDSVFNSPQVWLNVKIGSENLSPRKQLVAVAYAFQSASSALATTATTAISAKTATSASTANVAASAFSAQSAATALQSNWAMQANWATTATTALSAKSAPEADTLASVTARGASTSKELTLSGGIKTGSVSAPTSTGSVNLEDVSFSNGIITIPSVIPPSSVTNKLYQYNGGLYWYGTPVMLTRGMAYLYVTTTADPVTNGLYLKQTYDYAKMLKPYGKDLSTTNRLTVLVPPGHYDLAASPLVLDAQFIDLVGVSSVRNDQYLYGYMTDFDAALVRVTASDVHIENLFIEGTSPNLYIRPPAAFTAESNTTGTVVRNCEFSGKDKCVAMGLERNYPGYYEDCKAGDSSFGYKGAASGTFINCKAGFYSFGYNGQANGTFTNCSSGGTSFGAYGKANGNFTHCIGTFFCFGYNGVASGTFTECVGIGQSFASYGTASGKFINCSAGDFSFGYNGTASGSFTGCTAGASSFGSGTYSIAGHASGTFTNCSGGNYSFGAGGSISLPSYATGTFINCVGNMNSFGGYYSNNDGARLQGCRMTGSIWYGEWAGQMENCRWGTGLVLKASARIYGSTFLGNLNLNGTAAGVTQCRAKAILSYANNVFGATHAAALNISNTNVQ